MKQPCFPRGGLGWGKTDAKTQVSELFQTCVYTVVTKGRGLRSGVLETFARYLVLAFELRRRVFEPDESTFYLR